jgi:hypothetical protein
MKKAITLIIIVFVANNIFAQAHFEEWNKISLFKKISNKFSAILDINFRQQSNYKAGDNNCFHWPLMRSERLWLFYNLKNNYSIVGSLFYANTNDIINIKADLSSSKETQINIGLFNKSTFKKTVFRSRVLFEKRQINPSNTSNIDQFRYRFMELVTIPIKTLPNHQSINCVLFNEAFFKTQQSLTSFDQNRFCTSLQWHFPKVEYNIGFQKTYQNQSDNLVEKNQIILQAFLTL